jgi:hypothetical protein
MSDVSVSCRTAIYPGGDPVENVTVKLYDSVGNFIVTAVTAADGVAYLGDRAGATYEIRLSPPAPAKIQGGNTRQNIIVSNDATLVFDVIVDNSTLPDADDTQFCRCSGTFLDGAGQPERGMVLLFGRVCGAPNVAVNGASVRGITDATVRVETDSNGYASIDLLRGQRYQLRLGYFGDAVWDILVPDASSADLVDVCYPSPSIVEYRDAGTLQEPVAAPTASVAQGAALTLDLTTMHRSGYRVTGLSGVGLQADTGHWRVSASVVDHQLVVNGLSPGDVVFTPVARDVDNDVVVMPTTSLVGAITITVTDDPGIDDLTDPADGSVGAVLYDLPDL